MTHINTTNISFIEMHNLLKSKGVCNNDFMLKLNNEKISNLDPYSSNLSLEEKVMIYLECVQNPMYFFREIIRIPPFFGDTKNGNSFILNQANTAQLYLTLNNKWSFDMYCAQSLKTMTALCNMAYNFLFKTNYDQKIIGLHTKDTLKQLIEIIDHLPNYITQYKRYGKSNSCEKSMITNTINNNKITTSGNIKDQEDFMKNFGVGNSYKFILVNDMNIYENALYLYQSLVPSLHSLDGCINIVGIYFDNKFVRNMILNNKKWTNDLYDKDIHELERIYVVHFEPEEIIGKERTDYMMQVLDCTSKEDEIFIKTMCNNIPYFK